MKRQDQKQRGDKPERAAGRARRNRVALLLALILSLAAAIVTWLRRREDLIIPPAPSTRDPGQTARPVRPETAAEPGDDLTRIKGVGSVLQQYLADHGITTFRQIARLSDEEIDRVQEHMPGFPDRIRRDRWIDQARSLHIDKYGSEP